MPDRRSPSVAKWILKQLTPRDLAALQLTRDANDQGVGMFGSSLKSIGTEPSCQRLVRFDLAVLETEGKRVGYWLNDAGRLAMQTLLTQKAV